jgi:hypothetical protein
VSDFSFHRGDLIDVLPINKVGKLAKVHMDTVALIF